MSNKIKFRLIALVVATVVTLLCVSVLKYLSDDKVTYEPSINVNEKLDSAVIEKSAQLDSAMTCEAYDEYEHACDERRKYHSKLR